MMQSPTAHQIEAFFDGECPLCLREVAMIRRLDRHGRIRLTDIAAATFDPNQYGKSLDDFMQRMQGRLPDGSWLEGVEVFRRMYSAVGFGPLVAISRLPGLSHALDWAYDRFAANRLRWTGRCEADRCDVPPKPTAGVAAGDPGAA